MSASTEVEPRRRKPLPSKRRAGSRATFLERVVWISMGMHVPVAIAFTGGLAALHVPLPYLGGLTLAAVATLPIRGRLASMIADRPRPTLERLLIDEPYYVHWCATLGAAVPITLGCLFTPIVDLLRGRAPHVPLDFALATYLGLLAVCAWGVLVRRRWVRVKRLDIAVRDLPEAFDGYRIAQLSDLHIGGMTPKEVGDRWVRLANAEAVDLVVLTGDYVTSGTAFHDDIATLVSELRAKDGTFVSLGNHDYFGDGDPLVHKLRDRGVSVLRNESVVLTRDGQRLRLAAVDDTWTGRADLNATLRDVGDDPVVLLAHDPDLFEPAARLGADVVLSGHTHGGQIAFPFLARWLNLSALAHHYTYGRYQHGDATLYVHGGLGTTGPPIRLGVPPEVAIITLRRAT